MPRPTPPTVERRSPSWHAAEFVRRHMLWLLVVAYLLATFFPAAGRALRTMDLPRPLFGEQLLPLPLSVPLLLLATLLFCAALLTELSHFENVLRRPWALVLGLLAVWLAPALLVAVIGIVFADQASTGMLVGLALIATMPVANSSVGWTQNARGNLSLSLALILFSITLSPWVTPNLLQLLGLSLSVDERALCDMLVHNYSGLFFIVWVILPTALGGVCRALLGGDRVDRAKSEVLLTSALALWLLNYINAAIALPQVAQQWDPGMMGGTILSAILISAIGVGVALVLSRVLGESADIRDALVFGLSMKHTGLALVLAGSVLESQPQAILMIVVATVMQHLVAGVAQRWLLPRPA